MSANPQAMFAWTIPCKLPVRGCPLYPDLADLLPELLHFPCAALLLQLQFLQRSPCLLSSFSSAAMRTGPKKMISLVLSQVEYESILPASTLKENRI